MTKELKNEKKSKIFFFLSLRHAAKRHGKLRICLTNALEYLGDAPKPPRKQKEKLILKGGIYAKP